MKPLMVRDKEWLLSRLREVVVVPELGPCWQWTKSVQVSGYGQFTMDNKLIRAHRFAWLLFNGPVPDGILVCHKCDNPPCCNPEHLFLGTHADNARDKVLKGRAKSGGVCGERCNFAKVTVDAVIDIRRTLVRGNKGNTRMLADKYGIAMCTVRQIASGYNWKHIELNP
jgi:hypothetical protein